MMPNLDQPQTIDTDDLHPQATYRLANQDLIFHVDADTDLVDLVWPWAGETYARHIRMRVVALRDDPMTPLVTRFYPGYQEVILGNEGMIVSKRLCALLNSSYDRTVLWSLECQAEGDRLLRLEIDIEWDQPLTQRMVDGLLVAQRNPGPARGIYDQSNAESTCVFGNPFGRPDLVEIDDPQRARLVYHVLVNGVVEVPLLLTVSDVGEQMAWNGFLSLRDTERSFELSSRAWDELLKAGRLWTPDIRLNQAIYAGKVESARRVQRLRTGFAPSDRDLRHLPALVDSLDVFDLTQSRNLLAHARRLAERTEGRLPLFFPRRPQEQPDDPGPALVATNGAYITALYSHLNRRFDASLLDEHYAAVRACADALTQLWGRPTFEQDGNTLAAASAALRRALGMAMQHLDSVNMARWESEACEMERRAEALAVPIHSETIAVAALLEGVGWRQGADRPASFDEPWSGVQLAGQAVWLGCGIRWARDGLVVQPAWPAEWPWWALLDLPTTQGKLSLLWDGETLHSTQPVGSRLPVRLVDQIKPLKSDEHEFDLQFELTDVVEGEPRRRPFKPAFA